MKELPHTKSCFVCGEANPLGLNLRFETDGRIVRARFVPRPEHVGFRDTMHGGLTATVLDEVMVWACAVGTRQFSFCAELNVRYTHPVRPGEQAVVSAELTANHRNRLYEASGRVQNAEGVILAAATGKYLPIRDAAAAQMATDFVGDYQWIFELPEKQNGL